MYKNYLWLAALFFFGCGSGEQKMECDEGQWTCSDDALVLSSCIQGKWVETNCMEQKGFLCEQGKCIAPWRWGSPVFSTCDDESAATSESLHDKMVYYEDISRRLHIHPALKWMTGVTLPCDGEDCTRPNPPESSATYKDVESWHSGENDGLWSALYLAAEAFRYATTGEAEALDTLRLLMQGEQDRMAITGVPGVFTRQYIPPGVSGVGCPDDPSRYVPDVEKDDNQWVMVGDDGCVKVVDADSMEWVTTDHCGLDAYAGWCWLDNVSQDEYAGHMFALGAVVKLVDDPGIRSMAVELLRQVGHMLVDTRLEITDWDDRAVEHGRLYAMALDNFPGFNAAMALDYILMSAVATGDEELWNFYNDCLLQKHGKVDCIQRPIETPRPYPEYLSNAGLYVGQGSCLSNWNNISMHFTSLHNLIWFEHDPELRALYQKHLEDDVFSPKDTPKPVSEQHNAWFDFIYASQKRLGPDSDGPAYDAVRDGICMLRQFPSSQHIPNLQCPESKCQASCVDRQGGQIGDYPRTVSERCPGTFLWWQNPYDLGGCSENLRVIAPPGDYLLAYWMGRYYGFIPETL